MTSVKDQLEETELVLEGLREYHQQVTDRQQLENEIEYNLQMAGQHLMAALTTLRQLGDEDTADDLNDALHTIYCADGEYLDRYIDTSQELQKIAAKLRQVRAQRTRLKRLQDSSRVLSKVRALIKDDQSSVDEFTNERKRLRVPYKCENCSDIKEYDPEIAGDAIPCHSCNSPSVRSRANPDEAHLMRPRKSSPG